MRITELRQLIGRGEYQVEPVAVADAIVRRMVSELMLRAAGLDGAQPECS